jgi:four helix bundle protein
MQDYHTLDIWKRSRVQAVKVRTATERFPRSGYAELKSQMSSAAESIVFNIVEGCGAYSQKEFARFLGITIKSAYELESQLELASDYGILSTAHLESLANETIEIRKMTYRLREKVLKSLE